MKRILIAVVVVALVLVLAIVGVFAATFMGRRAIVDGQEIKSARVVADGFSSVAVISVGEREVLLIDAGEDAAGTAIVAELSRRGLSADAVNTILVTHGHQDHTAALKLFPKAQIMALEAEVPVVEGREGTHGPLTRLFGAGPEGITVTRHLRDGETLKIGNTSVRVFAVPGHTAGSAAYLVDEVLFIGDSADVGSEGDLNGSPWIFSDSQEENRSSLRRLAERLTQENLTVRAIVPAHSGPVEGLAPLVAFAQLD
jgi:glyoxylase-like metal-dependent hydrolase (beta-lactamase superfamily II)